MNKKKGLAAVIIAVIALAGVTCYVGREGLITLSKKESVEELTLNLSLLAEENIIQMTIQDEGTTTFDKKDGKWVNSAFEDIKYNEAEIEKWIHTFANMQSISVIHNVEDLAPYGINEQSRIVTLEDSEGHMQTFRIGQEVNGSNAVYVSSDETGLLYTVSEEMVEVVQEDVGKLIEKTIVMPILEGINEINITMQDGVALHLVKDLINPEGDWYLENYYKTAHRIEPLVMNELQNELSALYKESYVGEWSEENTYGLDKPVIELKLNNNYSLKFGNRSGGFVYFSCNDEYHVYKMQDQFIKYLETLKPIDMICKEVYRVNEADLVSIKLTNPQATYVLKMQEPNSETDDVATEPQLGDVTEVPSNTNEAKLNEVDETQKLEDKTDEAVVLDESQSAAVSEQKSLQVVSTLNDIALDETQTHEILALIEDSICIETALQNPQMEQKGDRKAEISVIYTLKNNQLVTIELIPYDTNFYILRFNNDIEFAVNKEKVTALFNELAQMVKG